MLLNRNVPIILSGVLVPVLSLIIIIIMLHRKILVSDLSRHYASSECRCHESSNRRCIMVVANGEFSPLGVRLLSGSLDRGAHKI